MDYYMLKMTWTNDKGKASLDPAIVRDFISQTHLIGLGSGCTHFNVFENLQQGNIVLVLGKNGVPQARVRVLDDKMEEYHPDTRR